MREGTGEEKTARFVFFVFFGAGGGGVDNPRMQ